MSPYGDNLFCNGVDYCEESANGGAGGCDVNPVNCVGETPQCSEAFDRCVECLNTLHCNRACVGGVNNGAACSSDGECPDGSCPADPDPIRNYCKTSTGVCVECFSNGDCTDGLYCTGQETCDQTTGNPTSGLCVDGTTVSCSPGQFCSEYYQGICVECEQNGDCDDDAYCTGVETCNQTTHNCDDGADIACKSCSGGTRAGQPCPSSAECRVCSGGSNNLQPCTVDGNCPGGTCPEGGTCTGPSTFCNDTYDRCVQCNFDNDCAKDFEYCTDAVCSFNSCVQVSNPVQKCGDGLYCNGQEKCLDGPFTACEACVLENQDPGESETVCETQKRCTGGLHPVCTTGSQCTSAFVCSNAPTIACITNSQCPSGGTCSVASTCQLACCGAGTPIDCSDPIACTMDKCVEATDSCIYTRPTKTCNDAARTLCDTNADCPQGFTCSGPAYCDDGLFCNGQETCGTIECENLTPRVCTNAPLTACTKDADCSGGLCQIDCSSGTTECTLGQCSEPQDQCIASPVRPNLECDDDDPCTINTFCNTQGQCLPSTTVNNAYWCVRLEWRNVTPQPVNINDFITADLYAVADNCGSQYRGACPSGNMELFGLNVLLNWDPGPIRLDPPGSPNPQNPCSSSNACYQCQTCSGGTNPEAKCVQRCDAGPEYGLTCLADSDCPNQECSGGPADGGVCVTNADCRVCVGGSKAGQVCASNLDCPDILPNNLGTCPTGGTCTTIAVTCSSTVLTCLGGDNNGRVCTVAGDCPPDAFGNPGTCSTQYTCQGGGVCSAPPTPSTYNWSNSPFFFLNDCESDGINGPCPYTGFPGNDGNAVYTAIEQPLCDGSLGPPVCVPPTGLFVTQFRFKALRGGQDQIAIGQCAGSSTKTSVHSVFPPPQGLTSTDVLKAIGLPADINVRCTTSANCDDGNVCTTDTCVSQNCEYTSNTLPCDDGFFCFPNDVCSNKVCVGSGTKCSSPTPICDETNDRCVQCLTAATCGDNNLCTQDICDAAGLCQHPPVDCGDGLSCTVDTCVGGDCRHTPDDSLCATGLFCSAKICDLQLDCVFDHQCVSAFGNPCDNPAVCDENADDCGGCLAPAAVAAGSRYLKVTPAVGQGTTPVAILIEGDCGVASIGCVSGYVQPRCAGGANNGQLCLSDADCPNGSCDKGFLGSSPVFMTAAQWGTVFVHASGIIPKMKYAVFAECDFGGPPVFSAPSNVQTYRPGDSDNDGDADFNDIAGIVRGYQNRYSPIYTYQSTNIAASPALSGCGDPQAGCIGQTCINFIDISFDVENYKGNGYPCPVPCALTGD
ncbi:MAG: hypothetical protein Q7R41_15615 [Phycisphaerales bacterium]|nr:hypothetical protein [Phycisphaerales bacterium]